MTAYRRFKLSEAAGPPAKVANPAKVRTPEPETLATLATLAAGNAQTTNLDGQLKDCAPLDPGEVELEERKVLAAPYQLIAFISCFQWVRSRSSQGIYPCRNAVATNSG
jgi:hypothetical protein